MEVCPDTKIAINFHSETLLLLEIYTTRSRLLCNLLLTLFDVVYCPLSLSVKFQGKLSEIISTLPQNSLAMMVVTLRSPWENFLNFPYTNIRICDTISGLSLFSPFPSGYDRFISIIHLLFLLYHFPTDVLRRLKTESFSRRKDARKIKPYREERNFHARVNFNFREKSACKLFALLSR